MKRSREAGGGIERLDDIIMLGDDNTVFQCKTCDRKFSSFQALGGHRTSHKKPRLMGPDEQPPNKKEVVESMNKSLVTKPNKMHGCSVCGLKFGNGQALGGHMRKHNRSTLHHRHQTFIPFPIPTGVPLDLNLTPLENGLGLLFELFKAGSL